FLLKFLAARRGARAADLGTTTTGRRASAPFEITDPMLWRPNGAAIPANVAGGRLYNSFILRYLSSASAVPKVLKNAGRRKPVIGICWMGQPAPGEVPGPSPGTATPGVQCRNTANPSASMPEKLTNPTTAPKPPARHESRLSLDRPALARLGGKQLQPNRGIPLNLEWVENVRVNTSAVERRAQTLVTRRTVKKDWQLAWLLRVISCMDLTTLSGDDTDQRVLRLCAKAKQPIQQELVKQLGIESLPLQVAAV